MRLLLDAHIPTSFKRALTDESWTTVIDCSEIFAAGTNDPVIANYAEQNDYVIFTRDAPFFEDIRNGVYQCGGIFLHMQQRYQASAVVDAIAEVGAAYVEHSEIAENIHDWM
jgi:hypothetical protein